jgi:hypothetical protein
MGSACASAYSGTTATQLCLLRTNISNNAQSSSSQIVPLSSSVECNAAPPTISDTFGDLEESQYISEFSEDADETSSKNSLDSWAGSESHIDETRKQEALSRIRSRLLHAGRGPPARRAGPGAEGSILTPHGEWSMSSATHFSFFSIQSDDEDEEEGLESEGEGKVHAAAVTDEALHLSFESLSSDSSIDDMWSLSETASIHTSSSLNSIKMDGIAASELGEECSCEVKLTNGLISEPQADYYESLQGRLEFGSSKQRPSKFEPSVSRFESLNNFKSQLLHREVSKKDEPCSKVTSPEFVSVSGSTDTLLQARLAQMLHECSTFDSQDMKVSRTTVSTAPCERSFYRLTPVASRTPTINFSEKSSLTPTNMAY